VLGGERRPRLLDQSAIGHAARARGLATEALDARLERARHLGRDGKLVTLDLAHEVDPPASWRIATCIRRRTSAVSVGKHTGPAVPSRMIDASVE
jgi:hypothetical protein